MALLRPGGIPRRPFSLRGVVVLAARYGQLYARRWPPARGRPRWRYQRAAQQRWAIIHRALKHYPTELREPLEEALAEWLRENRGLRASGAIRLRDWLFEILTGRMFAFVLPDGRTIYSSAVLRDCSDFLDIMEPRVGSLLVRTPDGWLCTHQCRAGGVLTSLGDAAPADACPPASIPPYNQAVGGY